MLGGVDQRRSTPGPLIALQEWIFLIVAADFIWLSDVDFPDTIHWELCKPASLINGSMESLDGNNTKDNEEEHHED